MTAPTTSTEQGPGVEATGVTGGTEATARRALTRWLGLGALGAGAAGVLHVAVAVEHVAAGDLVVGFFLGVAFAQVALAIWLVMTSVVGLRPDPRLLSLALLATVALIGLYVVSYTTSLLDGFGVHDVTDAGHGGAHAVTGHDLAIDPVTGVDYSEGVPLRSSEPVSMAGEVPPVEHAPGVLGSATVGAELLLIAALTALQPAAWRRQTANGLLALGVLAWGLWFTGVLA